MRKRMKFSLSATVVASAAVIGTLVGGAVGAVAVPGRGEVPLGLGSGTNQDLDAKATQADAMTGARHRSNMEIVAQGAANIASPLFGGLPAVHQRRRFVGDVDRSVTIAFADKARSREDRQARCSLQHDHAHHLAASRRRRRGGNLRTGEMPNATKNEERTMNN